MITWNIYSQNMSVNLLIIHSFVFFYFFQHLHVIYTSFSGTAQQIVPVVWAIIRSFYWLLINTGKHTHYTDMMCDIDIALNDYKAISLWINKQHRFNLQHSIMLKNCAVSLRHARLCSYTQFYFQINSSGMRYTVVLCHSLVFCLLYHAYSTLVRNMNN